MPNSRWPTQSELNDILGDFCLIMLCLGIIFVLISYSSFACEWSVWSLFVCLFVCVCVMVSSLMFLWDT